VNLLARARLLGAAIPPVLGSTPQRADAIGPPAFTLAPQLLYNRLWHTAASSSIVGARLLRWP
jgi:hypothetical protein